MTDPDSSPDPEEQLPPAPDPTAGPPEPPPGGVDASPNGGDGVDDQSTDPEQMLGRDPDPQDHPDAEDVPEVAKEGENTDTKATRGEEVTPEEESPA